MPKNLVENETFKLNAIGAARREYKRKFQDLLYKKKNSYDWN